MNLNEVNAIISKDLPDWQSQANLEFLQKVWTSLKVDGVWIYPADNSLWKKTESGFDQVSI